MFYIFIFYFYFLYKDTSANSAEPMNLAQLIGPFVVLGIGIFIASFISIYEFTIGVKKTTKKENVS